LTSIFIGEVSAKATHHATNACIINTPESSRFLLVPLEVPSARFDSLFCFLLRWFPRAAAEGGTVQSRKRTSQPRLWCIMLFFHVCTTLLRPSASVEASDLRAADGHPVGSTFFLWKFVFFASLMLPHLSRLFKINMRFHEPLVEGSIDKRFTK
jgi:hypothetical protein